MTTHVPTVRKPSPPDPVIISWSGLKRWENCGHHQLRHIQHKTEKSNMGRIFLPGTVADLTMREWLEQDDPQPGQMADMVEGVFERTVDKAESKIPWKGDPRTDKERVKTQVRGAVRDLEPWLLTNVIPYDYQPEVKFKAHFEAPYVCEEGVRAPITLIGGIDILVRRDNGKFRIYDLKMTSNPDYMRQTLGQLTFYDVAWGIISGDFYGAEEWGFVAPLLPEFFVPVTVERHDRQVMLSRMIKYAQGVWTDSWEPKSDDKGCNWCEARSVCDKFKTVAVVEENGKMLMSFGQAAAQRKQFRTDDRT